MIKRLALSFFLVVAGASAMAQSSWVSRVSDSLGIMATQYFYPSVLRALNYEGNEVFNDLISDIRYIRVVHADSAFVAEQQELLAGMDEAFAQQSYEKVIDWKEARGSRGVFLIDEKGKLKDLAVVMVATDKLLIVEIVGTLRIKSLKEIKDLDFGSIEEIIRIDQDL